jgi:hypothetical protein
MSSELGRNKDVGPSLYYLSDCHQGISYQFVVSTPRDARTLSFDCIIRRRPIGSDSTSLVSPLNCKNTAIGIERTDSTQWPHMSLHWSCPSTELFSSVSTAIESCPVQKCIAFNSTSFNVRLCEWFNVRKRKYCNMDKGWKESSPTRES